MNPKAVESVARALYEQRAKDQFGPYDAVQNDVMREAFSRKATALLDHIAPMLDGIGAEWMRETAAQMCGNAAAENKKGIGHYSRLGNDYAVVELDAAEKEASALRDTIRALPLPSHDDRLMQALELPEVKRLVKAIEVASHGRYDDDDGQDTRLDAIFMTLAALTTTATDSAAGDDGKEVE